VKKKHLHLKAKKAISELEEKGLTLTLDEKIWLNDIARKAESVGAKCKAIGTPAQAGSIWLWPQTIQAHLWYQDAVEWFDGDDEMQSFALGFSLYHARSHGVFEYLNDYQSAYQAVEDWLRRHDCTYAELERAMIEVCPQIVEGKIAIEADKKKQEQKQQTWDEILTGLILETNEGADFWLRFASIDFILEQINTINKQNEADEKRQNINAPSVKAAAEMLRAMIYIQESRNGKKTNNSD
jgi:hypothetical protein